MNRTKLRVAPKANLGQGRRQTCRPLVCTTSHLCTRTTYSRFPTSNISPKTGHLFPASPTHLGGTQGRRLSMGRLPIKKSNQTSTLSSRLSLALWARTARFSPLADITSIQLEQMSKPRRQRRHIDQSRLDSRQLQVHVQPAQYQRVNASASSNCSLSTPMQSKCKSS